MNVFETDIRVLGGLLSAHVLSTNSEVSFILLTHLIYVATTHRELRREAP